MQVWRAGASDRLSSSWQVLFDGWKEEVSRYAPKSYDDLVLDSTCILACASALTSNDEERRLLDGMLKKIRDGRDAAIDPRNRGYRLLMALQDVLLAGAEVTGRVANEKLASLEAEMKSNHKEAAAVLSFLASRLGDAADRCVRELGFDVQVLEVCRHPEITAIGAQDPGLSGVNNLSVAWLLLTEPIRVGGVGLGETSLLAASKLCEIAWTQGHRTEAKAWARSLPPAYKIRFAQFLREKRAILRLSPSDPSGPPN